MHTETEQTSLIYTRGSYGSGVRHSGKDWRYRLRPSLVPPRRVVSLLSDLTADYTQRCGWESVTRFRAPGDGRLHRRAVWVGVADPSPRVPLILSHPNSRHRDRAQERAARIFSL
jgi:hypothetical protein